MMTMTMDMTTEEKCLLDSNQTLYIYSGTFLYSFLIFGTKFSTLGAGGLTP